MTVRQRISHRLRPQSSGRLKPAGTAFVFSGGGIYGAMQVGQLRALLTAGITPDLIVGTSIGAINGTAFAADPTLRGLDRLAEMWAGLRSEDIFPGSSWKRAMLAVRRGDHLYRNDGVRRLIGTIPARTFEELHLPTHVVTAHLATGAETVFSSGPIAPALLASAALPGVFPPVAIDGQRYTDGGVVNNTPISVAIANGASRVIVISCGRTNQVQREARRPLDVLVQAFAHSRATRVDHDLERFAKHAKLEVVRVSDPPSLAYNDLSHSQALMEQAEAETTAWLKSR